MATQIELENRLSADIHLLGDTLGKVIREQAGIELYGLVEQIRALTKVRRSDGNENVDSVVASMVGNLDLEAAAILARAYTTYFELINVAEANHRIRVTREREREVYPDPLNKSVAAAIAEIWESGVQDDEMQALLNRLHIELVFTAHPTEAKRRTVLSKLQRIGRALYDLETRDLLPREKDEVVSHLHAEVTNLWLTGRNRITKPTVTDEVRVGLFYIDEVIWSVLPEIYEAMKEALARYYPTLTTPDQFLTYGSWMGGDRDGNPFVTADITAETLRLHRGLALKKHSATAHKVNRSLSMSNRMIGTTMALQKYVDSRRGSAGEHVSFLAERYPHEPYRLASAILAGDLDKGTADKNMVARLMGENVEDAPPLIRTKEDLLERIALIENSLRENNGTAIADQTLAHFRTQAKIFGLNAAVLDIRQESDYHDEVLADLFSKLGIHADYENVPAEERFTLLSNLLNKQIPDLVGLDGLGDKTAETLRKYRLLKTTIDTYGRNTIGPYIISMTRTPSDVMTVHLLCYWHGINKREDGKQDGINIAPLFETRADLEAAPEVMGILFDHDEYARHLKDFGDSQPIMIGYSDSNKDAGYFAANWELYNAQKSLSDFCDSRNITLTLFHGRGGTIARGGGPMKRAILAQPYNSVNGRFRNTEQGEVLWERYATPDIARRHLEQVVYSVLLASSPRRNINIKPIWKETMSKMAKVSHTEYRRFVYDSPELVTYWQQATPIRELSKMQIGSRPAKRAKSDDPFAFLRAIPWVFSWMQSRHVLPGWYGVGTALEAFVNESDGNLEVLQEMYRNWPFFKAVIDNAQMSLGKADMGISRLYAGLVEPADLREAVFGTILTEYNRTVKWVQHMTGYRNILDNEPVLQKSIRVRNPYVDPLNFIQVDLLREYRQLDPESAEAQRLLEVIFLTINGIASGLKSTG